MTRSRFLLAMFLPLGLAACGGKVTLDRAEQDAGAEADPGSTSSSNPAAATPCSGAGGSPGPAGRPVVLAHVASPALVAVDCSNLYVAPYETGAVTAVSLGDGSTTVLNPVAATTVAVDATHVYSVSPGGGDEPQGLVVACLKSGCGAGYSAVATGQANVWGVATDGDSVYFTNQGPPGAVLKAPAEGGPSTALVEQGSATAVAIAGGRVFFSGFTQGGSALLMSVPTGGGPTTALFAPDGGNSVEGLTADETRVYFSTTDGLVGQMAAGGGPLVTLATGQGNGILGLAVDDQDVYWAASEQGAIVRAPIGGGAVTTLATNQAGPIGIAVDASNVYWTNRGDGTVMKLAK
jgi:hypothetical protein